jgi:hypothetical protein
MLACPMRSATIFGFAESTSARSAVRAGLVGLDRRGFDGLSRPVAAYSLPMTHPRPRPRTRPGPWGWENARECLPDRSPRSTIEIGFYTDMPKFDETDPVTSGPYTLLVPWSVDEDMWSEPPVQPRMGLVLRVDRYIGVDPTEDYPLGSDWEQEDPDVYHGGNAWEELAALLSLLLGIRLRAGGILRVFQSAGSAEDGSFDPRGYPNEMGPPPYLPRLTTLPMLPTISDHARWVDFSPVSLLDSYSRLSAKQARTLVRSARSYQEAIWIADSDPRQAWLRLVTAVEALAQLQPDDPHVTRLRAVYPAMADRIAAYDDPELLEWVTVQFADQARSTAKFLSFLSQFKPSPPRFRPRYRRQNWTTIGEQFRNIYRARSIDLHQGIPIPRDMCRPPLISSSGRADEISLILSPNSSKEFLTLHIFEYIVRHAVQSWWRSTAECAEK